MTSLEIATENGAKFSGYFSTPAKAKAWLVVIQEIYGVNREIRRVVDHYAKAGFAVVAPDLLWRVKPGLDFDYGDRDGARKAIGSLNEGTIVSDIVASVESLRAASPGLKDLKGGLLALGWGGKYAYAASAKCAANAVASYYPGNLEGNEELTRAITVPQIFHFAAHDPRTKPEFRRALRTTLADRDNVEIYVYPDADHGFANKDRTEFHEPSAQLADQRTMEFLLRNLAAG